MVQIIFRLRRLGFVCSASALVTAAHAQVPNASQAQPQNHPSGQQQPADGATFYSVSQQKPTIEFSDNAAFLLAGGNTITNSNAAGVAVQIDHLSSLTQILANQLNYVSAPDTITGDGLIREQRSIDIGVGLVNGNPSLSWTTISSGIQAQQNSFIHLSGGVAITGAVQLALNSSGFANTNNSGTNVAGSGVVCSFTTMAAAHFAAPTKITPTVATAANYNSATSPQCLQF